MATWADRRDSYNAEMRGAQRLEQERRRLESERNALAEILRGAYTQGTPATPDRPYSEQDVGSGVGPLAMGEPIPGTGSPGTPGGFNMQNAIAAMARSRFAPEALKLASEYDQNMLRGKQLAKRPSDIEVYEYIEKLPEEKRPSFYRAIRAPQYGDIGGVRHEMPALPGGQARPLGTLAGEVAGQAAIAGGKEAGQIEAKTRTEAELAVPGSEMMAGTVGNYIDELKNHKGKKFSIGAMSVIPTQMTPGTSRVDFKARLDQLKGGAFLEARQLLKGGGQITDFEGKRAEAAMARLDSAQNEESFDAALEDFRTAVHDGVAKLKQKASGSPVSKQVYKIPKGAKTGTSEDGRKVFSTDGGKTVFDAETGKRVQ